MADETAIERNVRETSENGSSSLALSERGMHPLPDRIDEPELSVFRAFHERVIQAKAHLAAAEEALALFSPVIAHRFGIGEQDRIRPDGTIDRSWETLP